MAGRAISVTQAFTLPAQPTVGIAEYVPLGGDGYTAPFAAHAVRGFAVTGDAGGNFMRLAITLDPRFCHLISYLTVQVAQGTPADADLKLTLTANRTPSILRQERVVALPAVVGVNEIGLTWRPPSLILPGGDNGATVSAQFKNVLADVATLDMWAYLFNIRVRELTPMGPLLWAQGGSA